MRKTIVRILLSVLIFLGLDLLLGIFLIPDNFNAFRTKHYYYHHGLLPNQDQMAAWGALFYPIQTNSLGLIDSSVYKLQAQTKNKRLLILGDSHSEGVGIPYLKTFAGRLARSLAPKGIEVVNGSAVSYSQKIEYLKAKYLIELKELEVDEILVLIDISDLQNELVYEAYEPDIKSALGDKLFSMKSKLKHLSTIWYLADAIRTGREREQFFQSIDTFYEDVRDNPNNNIWELYSGFFSHFDNEVLLSNPQFHGMAGWLEEEDFRELALRGIRLGQQQMVKLKELCDRHEIGLTLSVHPWHYQIESGDVNDEYVQLWKSFAESQEISFINFFPLFINGEDPELVIKKYYIKNDNHWNEFGHEQVAAYLKDYYSKLILSDD
jgi:hypothetical protein